MNKCPKCYTINALYRSTCSNCGNFLVKLCPVCDSLHMPDGRHCKSCELDFTQDLITNRSLMKITDFSAMDQFETKQRKNETEAAPESVNQIGNVENSDYIKILGVRDSVNCRGVHLPRMGLTDEDIEPLKYLTMLRGLDLHGNKISDISVLKDMTDLRVLDLSFNGISDISVLKNLTNLEGLYLGQNNISDICVLKNLSGLKRLVLTRNNYIKKDYEDLKKSLPKCNVIPQIFMSRKDYENLEK